MLCQHCFMNTPSLCFVNSLRIKFTNESNFNRHQRTPHFTYNIQIPRVYLHFCWLKWGFRTDSDEKSIDEYSITSTASGPSMMSARVRDELGENSWKIKFDPSPLDRRKHLCFAGQTGGAAKSNTLAVQTLKLWLVSVLPVGSLIWVRHAAASGIVKSCMAFLKDDPFAHTSCRRVWASRSEVLWALFYLLEMVSFDSEDLKRVGALSPLGQKNTAWIRTGNHPVI